MWPFQTDIFANCLQKNPNLNCWFCVQSIWKRHLETTCKNTHTLSSTQILGPTTFAAPLDILNAKCFSGQAFEIPHLYLGGFVAFKRK